MSVMKRKFRFGAFFLFPESEVEEPFLNDMSRIGWHLVKTNYWCYTFKKGEPEDYQYRMDFITKELGRAEYIQLLQDAGWEIVDTRRDEFGVWAYCRKPRYEDGTLELYTDAESKLERIQRFKKAYWRMTAFAFLVIAIVFVIGLIGHGHEETNWGAFYGGAVGGVLGALISYIALWWKIRKIKKEMNTL